MSSKIEKIREIEAYLGHLRGLPFIRRARVVDSRKVNDIERRALSLETVEAKVDAVLYVSRTNLTTPFVSHIVHLAPLAQGPVFLFAPRVSPDRGAELEKAKVNYVDLAGNCHVKLGTSFIAHIEGKKVAPKPAAEKGMRAKGLQVLLALLTDPRLVNAPLRDIAAAADDVSPQTVSDVRSRLVHEGWVLRNKRGHHWAPRGRDQALDLLLGGYEQLAAHLLLGRFKSRPMPLPELERAFEKALQNHHFAWGGGAALQRLNGYYRGTRTIVYVEAAAAMSKVKALLVPQAEGEVVFSRFPGRCVVDAHGRVSPVLIYLDLMVEGEPRAREAAAELRETLFQEDGL
jgi:hypothetical protein